MILYEYILVGDFILISWELTIRVNLPQEKNITTMSVLQLDVLLKK